MRTAATRILVLLALASTGACARAQKAPPPELVPVRVGTVVQKAVPVQIRNVGTVVPYNTVSVRALVNGEILQVHFRDGEDVRKGDPLFSIDPRPYEAALAQAEGALARDRAQRENADADVKRYADLVKKDYVTAQQYDAVRANAAAFAASMRADEAAVEKARLDVGYCAIRSPLDGRTGAVSVQAGNVVKANDAVLVTINQVVPIWVAVAVPERDLAELRRRQAAGPLAVAAEDPATGRPLAEGELTFIDNTVDRATGTIMVKATFKNADRTLWPGEFVNASITLTTLSSAVVAPQGAVQSGQQGSYAYVVKSDDTVEARPLTVGRVTAGGTVIQKGLAPGERVVTDGQLRLRPGSKVEILPNEKTAEAAGQ
ncbi:MAG TPA: efflux RND transporter periplasmic adaptor subunit [Thermoanaerobaculia bacterium]|nr:efflux RND transporter periplasmic adaptor subunit [Thermoanaerobaculia bacterium]